MTIYQIIFRYCFQLRKNPITNITKNGEHGYKGAKKQDRLFYRNWRSLFIFVVFLPSVEVQPHITTLANSKTISMDIL